MLKTVTTIRELRLATAAWRRYDENIGFVPTMGALHDGHLALVKKAQNLSAHTVVSIFVNPLQFNAVEDLSKYPRTLEADKAKLEQAGCDLLFAPTVEEMYPEGFAVRVEPGPLAEPLEGCYRPGHFSGMATVVVKLLLQTLPDYACFGEKDFQQLRIVEQLVRDLSIPTAIVPVPIVRDHDGLALSSRNALLSEEARALASNIPAVLFDTAEHIRAGQDVAVSLEAGRNRLTAEGFKIDYFELADGKTLEPLTTPVRHARLLIALKLGRIRLIDNTALYSDETQIPVADDRRFF